MKKKILLVFLLLFFSSNLLADEFVLDGSRFFYIEKGQAKSIPIVVLHGLPDSAVHQKRLIESLGEQFHVFAFDRLGMGMSEKPLKKYSYEDQVSEIDRVLVHHKFEKVILLGHSVGGGLAVSYAHAYPEKVSGMVLMNPTLIFERGHTGLKDVDTWFLKLWGFGETLMVFHSRMVVRTVLKVMFHDDTKITTEMIERYFSFMDARGAKRHFLGTLRSFYKMPSRDLVKKGADLSKKGMPILLVWAENDAKMPIADGHLIAKDWGAPLQTVPKSGHLPQLELSDVDLQAFVVQPIVDFLASLRLEGEMMNQP